jgi:hypothetical protein
MKMRKIKSKFSYKNNENIFKKIYLILRYCFRILVCITIYSEGYEELEKTLAGVVNNL